MSVCTHCKQPTDSADVVMFLIGSGVFHYPGCYEKWKASPKSIPPKSTTQWFLRTPAVFRPKGQW